LILEKLKCCGSIEHISSNSVKPSKKRLKQWWLCGKNEAKIILLFRQHKKMSFLSIDNPVVVQAKILGGPKLLTLGEQQYLGHRLSKHEITKYAKNWGERAWPSVATPARQSKRCQLLDSLQIICAFFGPNSCVCLVPLA